MEPDKARELHDELLASKPDQARHDSDICPFCVDKALSTTSANPPASGRSDVTDTTTPNDGGRDEQSMTTATDEKTMLVATHEALMEKAIRDATSATEGALGTKTEELAAATAKLTELTAANEKLTAETARLNTELDTAQVGLKAATDEVATLKADIAAKDEASAKSTKATERAEQVTKLGLFTEEYVTEKASVWADLSDDDFAARLAEWTLLKPAKTDGEGAGAAGDTASAMSGTTGGLTDEASGQKKTSARRAALGLT